MPERKHFFSGGLPLITSVSKVKFYTNVPWLSCTCEWNMACDEKIQALGCVWPQILPKPSSWNPFAHIQHHLLHIHPKCCVSASNLAFQISKAGHEHCSKNDFGYWDECAGLLWTSEMSVSSVELTLTIIRVQRERAMKSEKSSASFPTNDFNPTRGERIIRYSNIIRIVESEY